MQCTISLRELMIVAAARHIRDGEVVFTGMRLPLLAFCLAKTLHAPRAIGLFEAGVVRDTPPPELLYTMSDPPNNRDALWCTGLLNVMALLQRGHADLAFIGAAEVDRFGNVNTSYIGDWRHPTVKLPGSGGAADLAALAHRTVIIVDHDRRRLPARRRRAPLAFLRPRRPGKTHGGRHPPRAGFDPGLREILRRDPGPQREGILRNRQDARAGHERPHARGTEAAG